jgi:hypothetical protein
MWAKYALFESVRDIPYERLAIKMKPEYDNLEEHKKLLNEIKN